LRLTRWSSFLPGRFFLIVMTCTSLVACASYKPLPLPAEAKYAASLRDLSHSEGPLANRLTVTDIAEVALENNLDLRAARAQSGVARAQMLQAGMPPNPSVTGALLPLVDGPGVTTAYNTGLTYDFKSLVTLSARRRSAEQAAHQVDAQILWQEWQVVGQARLLAVDIMQGERSRKLLAQARDLLSRRVDLVRRALAAGNTTLVTLAPDVAALQSIVTQAKDLDRLQLQRRHQLNALLGLAPDASLPLAERPDLPSYDGAAVLRSLPSLAARRPDLVALRFGYAAEDEKLRAAILAQFPNLTIGVTGGSDNSYIRNFGPQITLELPIFDRNQGNIAIERATRQRLHDEYAARLSAADGQVRAMVSEIALLSSQLDVARRDAVLLRRSAAEATAAFNDGNLDERSYVDFVSAELAKEQEILSVEQSILEQQIAVATLVGAGMPRAANFSRGSVQP
jgi:outer membrane protein TolC